MANITFKIVHTKSHEVLKEFNTLVDAWKHIRLYINDSRSWGVEEFENGELVDLASAHYLIESFKNEDDVPFSIQDMD